MIERLGARKGVVLFLVTSPHRAAAARVERAWAKNFSSWGASKTPLYMQQTKPAPMHHVSCLGEFCSFVRTAGRRKRAAVAASPTNDQRTATSANSGEVSSLLR